MNADFEDTDLNPLSVRDNPCSVCYRCRAVKNLQGETDWQQKI